MTDAQAEHAVKLCWETWQSTSDLVHLLLKHLALHRLIRDYIPTLLYIIGLISRFYVWFAR